ncbi:MAG: MarR family winged helix-turn-helix transcriptional regulator [Leptospirillia bacterium]
MAQPEVVEEAFFRELIPAAGINSEVMLNIVRAGNFLFDELAENFRAHGMSAAQFGVLVALEDADEGRTLADIARRMLVSRAGMTVLIRGLEHKGWIVRTPDPEDARAVRVRLGEAGKKRLAEVLPGHLERVEDMIGSCFTADEKKQLVRLLTRLRGSLAARRAKES